MKNTKLTREEQDFNKVRISKDRYIAETYGTLSSKDYRLTHRDHTTVLNYLKRYAVRTKNNYDLGLHDRFWKYGYLVSSKSLRDLAAAFGYTSLSQIRAMLNKLVKSKELYVAEVNVGKHRPQHVYVVGIHNGRPKDAYEELYFTTLKFNPQLNGRELLDYLREFDINKKLVKWKL